MKSHNPAFFKRCLGTFLLIAVLVFNISNTAYAVPDDASSSADTAEETLSPKWVDLQAHVPEGFKGSVSVLLQHDETGELYTVTSYFINDYLNSIQIPQGKYTVMQAFSSEDSFLYDVFLETEAFELKTSQKLEVTVKVNKEGAAYLEQLQSQPTADSEDDKPATETETEPEIPATSAETDISSSESEQPSSEDSLPTPDNSSEEPAVPDSDSLPEDPNQESSKPAWISILEGLVSALGAGLIFGVIFFGIVFLIRKFQD